MSKATQTKVILTYFKKTGKYYSEGEYASEKEDLMDIWDEVRGLQIGGNLPGLARGFGGEFIILVNAPGHPHDHPNLII